MAFRFLALLAIVGWTLIPTIAHATDDVPPRAIYLLMGQSNMSGRGLLAEIPPHALAPDGWINLYGNDGLWRVAAEPLDSATGQVDSVSADDDGVGPGLAFAKQLLDDRGKRPIGLVPCAKGGSGIVEWAASQARDTLYGSCLARAREAAANGRIAGILWYQGETDAHDAMLAAAWSARFTAMITQFRADLGQPDLPLVIVGIGDQPLTGKYAGRFPEWAAIQQAQRALTLLHMGYVSAIGLARNADDLHLSTASQIILGKALARAMEKVR